MKSKKLSPLAVYLVCAAAIVLLLAADQYTKSLAVQYLKDQPSIELIPGVLELFYLENRGMAFGLMNRPDPGMASYLLIAVTVIAVILILLWAFRLRHEDRRLLFGLSLILGGAVGNLIDRVRIREVIDFIDVYIGSYHWPAFNIADSAITVGTCWIAVCIILFNKKENAS